MNSGNVKPASYSFAVFLLLLVNNVRSGVLVDTSFLPRFLLLTLLLLAVMLILFRKKIALRITYFEKAFLLLYLWSLLSALWAIVPSEAIVQSQLIFVSLSVYLVISLLNNRNIRFESVFIRVSLFSLLCSFGLAFYKMSLLEHFDPYRIVSVSANNNLFAGLLLISMPLALAGYAMFQGFMKYVSVAVATLALFFIVILQSRAVYLGLCCAGLVFIILLAVRFRVLITRKNILVAGIFLMLLSLGIGIFYASLDQTRKYYFLSKVPVWQYFQSYDAGMKDLLEKKRKEKAALNGMPAFDFAESYYENANLRVIFWKKSAGLFAAHPLKGVGAGNWRINVPSCPKPDNPDHTFKNYTYSQPHNEWIGIITELGVPGFLLMVIVFFVPVIILYYKLLVQKLVMPFSVAVYLSFITGFYLYACFDFPFHRIEHNVIFFAVMALMTGKSCLPENSGAYHVKPWRYLRFILVGGLIFTTMVIVLRIRGEFFTRLMFRYEGRDQEKVIFYGRQAGSCCYRLTPNTLPLDWFIGVAEYRLRQPAKALQSFQKALLVTPYEVRVLNDRATALYSLGKVDQARAVLKKTLAIDPFFDDARFNLAAMLYFAGKSDSARLLVTGCRESEKKKEFLREMD